MRNYLLFLTVFACIACNKTKNSTTETPVSTSSEKDQFLTVDLTKEYPKSERICLQDIADVEYIPLETNNDFLLHGDVSYLDDSIIIFRNFSSDGDIFIFDWHGKAKRKINRKGQSEEEYVILNSLFYDNEKNELYVNDMMQKKIIVYDMEGHYKRSFHHLQGTQYNCIYLFNDQYLLCYNGSSASFEKEKHPFKIVSKQTGQLIKELDIPFSKRISTKFYFTENNVSTVVSVYPEPEPAMKAGDEWILNEVSSDTIYQLSKNLNLTPFMAKTPSVQSMAENPQYLGFVMDSYHYRFMFIQKKDNLKAQPPISTTVIMYDKKAGKFFEQNFYNADSPDRDFEFGEDCANRITGSNQYFYTYSAPQLKKLLDNGKLTGRLKEIAEKINEDDNPVLMIVTFKK